MKPKVLYLALKAVIVYQNKVLLLKRNPNVEQGPFWDLPGGRINEGQPATPSILKKNLLREIKEETGLTNLSIGSFLHAEALPEDLEDGTGLVFLIYKIELDNPPSVELSEEHVEFRWCSLTELPMDLPERYKIAIYKIYE